MTPVEQIKEKLDIVEFIRSYITLQPAGRNFKANCPFHKEKTPSFIVSPDRQTWHCFGSCSEGGDIFKFLMKYENLEFQEALKILAERAGIELGRTNSFEQKQIGVLYDINEKAKDFFKKNLELNKEAADYLKSRGLNPKTIEEFELGYAANEFEKLTLHLIKSGYNIKDIERSGLAFKKEKGGYMDRFRSRIMFPIYNHTGKTIGFSGRILPRFDTGETGKYVNSPETPIFNKSKILYGFHKSKNFIREEKSAVLVEGQMDFLMLWQDGVKNIAATSGTALTFDHLKTLKRQTDNLIFCFDNDEAGLNAAERGIDMAIAYDFNVKISALIDYKDPAEAVFSSPGKISELLKNSLLIMEFYFNKYLPKELKPQLPEFKNSVRNVLEKIKHIASPIERNHWLKELSQRIKIEEKILIEELEKLKTVKFEPIKNRTGEEKDIIEEKIVLSRRELISQRILSLIIIKDDFKEKIAEYANYLPVDYFVIFRNLVEKTDLTDTRLINLLNFITLRSSFESEVIGEQKLENEFDELLCQLNKECLKEKGERLVKLIKEAEKNGDEENVASRLKEFDEISKLMHN
ncbi:MAG: DNA primase [Patescibacteria group bacterium]